jgi:hypothetical protein
VPKITTAGQIKIKKALPEDMRSEDRTLDASGLRALLSDMAVRHPDDYRVSTKKLMDLSRVVSTRSGGYSFDLTHMRRNKAATKYRDQLQQQLRVILGDDSLDDTERNRRIIEATKKIQAVQPEEIFQEELANRNPLSQQVLSGARGSKKNLAGLISGDMLYEDSKGTILPVPIMESFSEGSSGASYLASVFGARKSVQDTKLRTADAGYFGKQLNQIAHRTLVADEDEEGQEDDGRPHYTRGMPTDVDDIDNEGALIAQAVGGYDRNTVLTPKILRDLKRQGVKRMLVRSVIANGLADGSVYAKDVGVFENGRLPSVGTSVGNPSAQATSEPVSQGSLGSKHGGGVAGATKAVSGFEELNALIQAPKIFPGGAAHAEEDGAIQRISDAPAGGQYVYINDKEHFVQPGRELKVKPGDTVEAGDVLSDGTPHPAMVTKYKGIGEGQRYWAHAMRDAMRSNGMLANRRNMEVLANSLIGHVKLDDEVDGWAPDEVVPYRLIANNYRPRRGAEQLDLTRAAGQYLEAPVLHYSIGTKIRPSVLKTLQEFGIPQVTAHRDPPPFQPQMIRAADNLQYDEDWMTRMYGSGLKSSLLDAVHAGSTSDAEGSSFVPGLARGAGFGTYGKFISNPKPAAPLLTAPSFKTGGDVNATPNKSTTNTTPAGGSVSGGASRPGDYSTGGLSSLAESHGSLGGGMSGLSIGGPAPRLSHSHPDYVPPSSNGGIARPGQTAPQSQQVQPPAADVTNQAPGAQQGAELGFQPSSRASATGTILGNPGGQMVANKATSALVNPAYRLRGGAVAAGISALGPAVGNLAGQVWNGKPVNWGEVGGALQSAAPDAAAFGVSKALLPKGGFLPAAMIGSVVGDVYDRTLGVGGEKATQNAGEAMDAEANILRGNFDPKATTTQRVMQTGLAAMGTLMPSYSRAVSAYRAYNAGNEMQQSANQKAMDVPKNNADRLQRAEAMMAAGDNAGGMKLLHESATNTAGAAHVNALNKAPTWSRTQHAALWDQLLGQQIDLSKARVNHAYGFKEDGTPMTPQEKAQLGTAIGERARMIQHNVDLLNGGFTGDLANFHQQHYGKKGSEFRPRVALRT